MVSALVHQAAQGILNYVQATTGYPVILTPDARVRIGELVPPQTVFESKQFIIKYNPNEVEYLDHIVAHECGHLLRDWPALQSGSYREMEYTPRTVEAAKRVLIPEIRATEYSPERAERSALRYVKALLQVLYNMPIDIRIEHWLHNEHTDLIPCQAEHVTHLLRESDKPMPHFAPETVRNAHLVFGAAYARAMAPILGDEQRCYTELLISSVPREADHTARRLLQILDEIPDANHESDIQAVDLWAEELGFTGWYAWKLYHPESL